MESKILIPSAKIYKLVCADGYFYIGSTVRELRERLSDHRYHAKYESSPLYKHLNLFDKNDIKIELIENYPCNTYIELRIKETEHIKQHLTNEKCLNKNKAHITYEEFLEKRRAKHHANKEVENEKRRQRRIRQKEREKNQKN